MQSEKLTKKTHLEPFLWCMVHMNSTTGLIGWFPLLADKEVYPQAQIKDF